MEANRRDFYPLCYLLVKRGKDDEVSTAVNKYTHFVPTSVSILTGVRHQERGWLFL